MQNFVRWNGLCWLYCIDEEEAYNHPKRTRLARIDPLSQIAIRWRACNSEIASTWAKCAYSCYVQNCLILWMLIDLAIMIYVFGFVCVCVWIYYMQKGYLKVISIYAPPGNEVDRCPMIGDSNNAQRTRKKLRDQPITKSSFAFLTWLFCKQIL